MCFQKINRKVEVTELVCQNKKAKVVTQSFISVSQSGLYPLQYQFSNKHILDLLEAVVQIL